MAPPLGDALWQQSRWAASGGALKNFVLNEPRAGAFRNVNLLVPPKDPAARMGFIMEPKDTPPMSGSNSTHVVTVSLDAGILPLIEP